MEYPLALQKSLTIEDTAGVLQNSGRQTLSSTLKDLT